MKFIDSFSYIYDNIIEADIEKDIISISEALEVRLLECREKDIIEIDLMQVSSFCRMLDMILDIGSCLLKKDFRKSIYTNLILYLFRRDNIAKNIQGLNLFLESTKIQQLVKENPYSLKYCFKEEKKLANDLLEGIPLIKIIFDENFKPELIKLCGSTMRYLILSRKFSKEDLFIFISCYRNKIYN